MKNLELIMNTEAFKTYIEDPEELYADARSLDKWQLVKNELIEKGYKVEINSWDLFHTWCLGDLNELPQIKKSSRLITTTSAI